MKNIGKKSPPQRKALYLDKDVSYTQTHIHTYTIYTRLLSAYDVCMLVTRLASFLFYISFHIQGEWSVKWRKLKTEVDCLYLTLESVWSVREATWSRLYLGLYVCGRCVVPCNRTDFYALHQGQIMAGLFFSLLHVGPSFLIGPPPCCYSPHFSNHWQIASPLVCSLYKNMWSVGKCYFTLLVLAGINTWIWSYLRERKRERGRESEDKSHCWVYWWKSLCTCMVHYGYPRHVAPLIDIHDNSSLWVNGIVLFLWTFNLVILYSSFSDWNWVSKWDAFALFCIILDQQFSFLHETNLIEN